MRALGKGAADAGLTELPTLPKATLMAEFDRIVTDPRLTLKKLFARLGGGRSGMPAVSVVTPPPELLAALDDYRPDKR